MQGSRLGCRCGGGVFDSLDGFHTIAEIAERLGAQGHPQCLYDEGRTGLGFPDPREDLESRSP